MSNSRKGSASGKTKASDNKCRDCDKAVLDKDKGIQCEVCELWFHPKCQDISEELYKYLEEKDSLHWFCSMCNVSVTRIIKSIAAVQAKQDKMEKELGQVVIDLRAMRDELTAVSEKVNANDTKLETVVEASLVEGIEKSVWTRVNDRVNGVKEDVSEAMEIEKRKTNIVFHGVKESVVPLEAVGRDEFTKSPDQELVEEVMRGGLRLDATRHRGSPAHW